MTQPSLFDRPPGHAEPLVRKRDPMSSHEAADRMEQSGNAEAHEVRILNVLRFGPTQGITAQEIAERCALRHEQVHRRLRPLQRRGLIETVRELVRDERGDLVDQEVSPLRWRKR